MDDLSKLFNNEINWKMSEEGGDATMFWKRCTEPYATGSEEHISFRPAALSVSRSFMSERCKRK